MEEVVTVGILTKSSKNGGYCVAGIEMATGKWIRLVSNDEASHGALFDRDMILAEGGHCKPLDIVDVPITETRPNEYQPENVLFDPECFWEKVGELTLEDLLRIHPVEDHTVLLGNEYRYITVERVGTVGHSLILVKVKDMVITRPEGHSPKATFIYKGTEYANISVTDPDYYRGKPEETLDSAILVMSLPDAPFRERYFYKFVAKIFPLE